MIQECRIYVCDGIPLDEDIFKAIEIVQQNKCLIRLEWFVPYSGHYHAMVALDSTLESVKKQIPRVYGI